MPVNRRSALCSLFLLFLLSLFNSLQSQVCTNLQYVKSYTAPGSGNMHFFFQLTDGNFIMGGPVNGKIMLIKINADGDTLWNKRYDCSSINHGSVITMKALQGKNGNIYCFIDNGYLLKLDIDGNVLASNRVFAVGGYNFLDFDVLNNGDLVLLLDRVPDVFLARINPDTRALIWMHYFERTFAANFKDTANFKDVMVEGDSILIAGNFNSKGKIISIDANTGHFNPLMVRGFTINNRNVTVDHIYNYKGGYIAHAYASGATDNHFTVRLDKSLRIINTYSFTNIPGDAVLSYAVEPDGSYYLAHGTNTPKLLHVNKNDALLWTKSNSSIISAHSYLLLRTNQGLMATSGMNYTAVGTGINWWYYCVSKSDLNGEVGNCASSNYPVTLIPATVQNNNDTVTVRSSTGFAMVPVTAIVIPEVVNISTNCLTQKLCSSVTIAGPVTICGNTGVNFKAVRNSSCSLPIEWKIEGAATDNEVLNDSMVSIKFLQNGNYRLIASLPGACRLIADTLDVQAFAAAGINLGPDTPICNNNTIRLDAGNGFATYKWQDNSSGSFYDVTQPGKYYVEATDACSNKYSDTITITKILPSPANFLPADTSICSYGRMELKTSINYRSYVWSTGERNNKIMVSKPGFYTLTVKDAVGCEGKDEILVAPKDCLEGFFIPNSFSPNADGRNDLFKPALLGIVVSYRFTIYNRWGQRIFETADLEQGWDGILAGKPQFNNVFVWVCAFQFEGQAARLEKGYVIPVR
jgi:gliding motility-associated-like protein